MSDDLVKRLRDDSGDWLTDLAADRIEELEAELLETQDRANAFATKEYYTEMRAERAEAKLAKAVEALQGLVPILCEGFEDGCGKLSRHDCAACEGYATLAELTGGKDE